MSGSSFTKEQQAQHCDQLADLLETIKPSNYEHSRFVTENDGLPSPTHTCNTVACALGWAAIAGIGGMMNGGIGLPYHPDEELVCDAMGHADTFSRTERSADRVFGDLAYDGIFDGDMSVTEEDDDEDHDLMDDIEIQAEDRVNSIARLRAQAQRLRSAA